MVMGLIKSDPAIEKRYREVYTLYSGYLQSAKHNPNLAKLNK
ncbi:hypothetical protein PC129_g14247 [Phytophthora cactorum]|uniref:Uncharacterized protein n=1 Tax=Phytophthora cactorum TaxID=29920 RepID=A0A329RWX8_9STRA|nr:hypothetical protein Pcac1_g10102 [Phytophthora cactorum]KAG2811187.1 hypothetical protein PC111_g15337 [Phytophthora cactorum]KAG2829687.1 hypothetical protein PC112_g7988 [Phytophthora cactorum]KAG2860195.1 hypothetical protein PC113_g8273 [Phytophthora cactorum]KAG2889277.1 hypothetical protein PC114_g18032 [Phytophthora cactorum]